MPRQSGTSVLSEKLGNRLATAHKKTVGKEVNYGSGGELPEGVNGIAQLVVCRVGTYKTGEFKGKLFFRAEGIVISPDMHEGIPVKGLRTSIQEPLCDTPKRENKPAFDDHWDWVVNQLKMLGLDTDSVPPDKFDTPGGAMELLAKAGPYFRFHTWKGDDWENPQTKKMVKAQVRSQWDGLIKGYAPSDNGDGVEDNTGDVPVDSVEGESPATEDVPFGDEIDMLVDLANKDDDTEECKDAQRRLEEMAKENGKEDAAAVAKTWDEVGEMARKTDDSPAEESSADDGLTSLGALADDGDEDAQGKITAAGEAAGVEDTFENWPDWVTAILAEKTGGGSAEIVPKKEDVFGFKPPRARKAVDCAVTAVFEGKKTCNLRNLDDQKVYKSVPWDKLISE